MSILQHFTVVWVKGGDKATSKDHLRAAQAANQVFAACGVGSNNAYNHNAPVWVAAEIAADHAATMTWDNPDDGKVELSLGTPSVPYTPIYPSLPREARQLLEEVVQVANSPMRPEQTHTWLRSLAAAIQTYLGRTT